MLLEKHINLDFLYNKGSEYFKNDVKEKRLYIYIFHLLISNYFTYTKTT